MSMEPVSSPLTDRVVLVVEDSRVQLQHAVDMAKTLGASQVLEARDGVEAMELFRSQARIDLLLCDLEMPRMDGITLIGEIAARGYRPDVIIVSALESNLLNSVRLMARTYGLSVPGVLPKPLTTEGLSRLLANAPKGKDHPFSNPEAQQALGLDHIRNGIRNGEFICFFQPQITFQGALLKGAEALVRWRNPDVGLLGPAAFLPQAESDTELISELTFAVMENIAIHWHNWRRHGLSLQVSVNLSARSLSEAGFSDRIMEAARSLDFPSSSLVFEVTESASISDLGHTLSNLARLRMKGFKLSIDDFGTGFATFEQLERIPFTELKIDRSITCELPGSHRHEVMARHILSMAKDLELTTVAEGIETLECWASLRSMGCSLAQGYLISRPMPGEQIPEWSRKDRSILRSRP